MKNVIPIFNIKGDISSFKQISFYGHNSLTCLVDLFGLSRKDLDYDPRYIIFQGECYKSDTLGDTAVQRSLPYMVISLDLLDQFCSKSNLSRGIDNLCYHAKFQLCMSSSF